MASNVVTDNLIEPSTHYESDLFVVTSEDGKTSLCSHNLRTDSDPMTRDTSSEVDGWMFFKRLRASGLIRETELQGLEHRFMSEKLETVRQVMVESGRLTAYQFKQIDEGHAEELVLGQYKIIDELGHGGFGHVFKAQHQLMNRTVALKIINRKWTDNPLARQLFLREVAVTTQLNHPNIVHAYDANEVNGVLLLAMEFVEGTNLERYLHKNGPLPSELVRKIMLQLGGANHAHEHRVVHRDIKPANLLLPKPSQSLMHFDPQEVIVKVADFGLARFIADQDSHHSTIHSQEGTVVGTPAFMAPEQLRNVHDADIRSDLYSLGCTVYFALTGQEPFGEIVTQEYAQGSRPIPIETPAGCARAVCRSDPATRLLASGGPIPNAHGIDRGIERIHPRRRLRRACGFGLSRP